MTNIKLLWLTFVFFGCTAIRAQTQLPQPFEIQNDTADSWLLDSIHWQVLPDRKESLTINQVLSAPVTGEFRYPSLLRSVAFPDVSTYWFRFRVHNTLNHQVGITLRSVAGKADFYVLDAQGNNTHLRTGYGYEASQRSGIKISGEIPVNIPAGATITVYYRRSDPAPRQMAGFSVELGNAQRVVEASLAGYEKRYFSGELFQEPFFMGFLILAGIFNFFFFMAAREKIYLCFSLFLLTMAVADNFFVSQVMFSGSTFLRTFLRESVILSFFFLIHFIRFYFKTFEFIPAFDRWLVIGTWLILVHFVAAVLFGVSWYPSDYIGAGLIMINLLAVSVAVIMASRRSGAAGKFFLLAIAPFLFCLTMLVLVVILAAIIDRAKIIELDNVLEWIESYGDSITMVSLGWAVIVFSWALFSKYNKQRHEIAWQALEKERLAREAAVEKNELIETQKIKLEEEVTTRTSELKQSLEHLKSAQAQLIHKEKMASLGELTAGIAHEIQNPLNFVNNFSDVNAELIGELEDELNQGNIEESLLIASDIRKNLEKISHHGDRADLIVKSMLQHSRSNTGSVEPTDINALAEEYLKLAYHGQRAKDKNFNVDLQTNFDHSIGKIRMVPQEIGRVLLNLYTNAFYAVYERTSSFASASADKLAEADAVQERNKQIENKEHISEGSTLVANDIHLEEQGISISENGHTEATTAIQTEVHTISGKRNNYYQPVVFVSTNRKENGIELTVRDNGLGMPESVREKIFQPFFTTKPTGQGTGLGLSMSYDIIKAHGGEINAHSTSGEGTTFVIWLPE